MCQQDCIGYWNGSAYLDNCGFCVGGTTGGTPCAEPDPSWVQSITNSSSDPIEKIEVYDLFGRRLKTISPEDAERLSSRKLRRLTILKIIRRNTTEVKKYF